MARLQRTLALCAAALALVSPATAQQQAPHPDVQHLLDEPHSGFNQEWVDASMRAVRRAEALHDLPGLARALLELADRRSTMALVGADRNRMPLHRAAAGAYRLAAGAFRQCGSPEMEKIALLNFASVMQNCLGEPRAPEPLLRDALERYTRDGHVELARDTAWRIACGHKAAGRRAAGLRVLEAFRDGPLSQAPRDAAEVWLAIAVYHFDRPEDTPLAVTAQLEALRLRRAAGDPDSIGLLCAIAGTYRAMGEPQADLTYSLQALARARSLRDARAVTDLNRWVGDALCDLGEPRRALPYLTAVAIQRRTLPRVESAHALILLGRCWMMLGEPALALRLFDEAAAMWRPNPPGGPALVYAHAQLHAYAQTSAAEAYAALGRPDIARARYEAAIPRLAGAVHEAFRRRDPTMAAQLLGDLGQAYGSADRRADAVRCLSEAVRVTRGEAMRRLRADYLARLGRVLLTDGQLRAAAGALEEAVRLYEVVGPRTLEADTLIDLGAVCVRLGDAGRAATLFRRALHIGRAIGDPACVSRALLELSRLHGAARRWHNAAACAGEASALAKKGSDRWTELEARIQLAGALDGIGRPLEAERAIHAAVRLLEAVQGTLGIAHEVKASLVGSRIGVYHQLIALLLRRGRTADAFAVAQRAKARSLMASAGQRPGANTAALPRADATRLRALQTVADDLARRMVSAVPDSDPRSARLGPGTRARLLRAEARLADFSTSLCLRNTAFARARGARFPSLEAIGNDLGPDTALLEYVDLAYADRPASTRPVVFVITSRRGRVTIHAFRLPATTAQVAAAARRMRSACADPQAAWRKPAAVCHRMLIAPVEQQLRDVRRLVVCPDGALWRVPFQALIDGTGTPLQERFGLSYGYSAATHAGPALGRRPRKACRPGALVVAAAQSSAAGPVSGTWPIPRSAFLGPLPGAQREAKAVARALPGSRLLLGATATEEAVVRAAPKYRYLHFATHSVLNHESPLLSSLVLAQTREPGAPDGFLTAREIAQLRLDADVAFMAGCDTGGGRFLRGDGLVGLCWALSVAGSRTQVVAQWRLDDRTSEQLVKGFYEGLRRGLKPADALQEVSRRLRRDRARRHPYFWAPFAVLGGLR